MPSDDAASQRRVVGAASGLRRPDLPVAVVPLLAAVCWWLVGYLPWIASGLSGPLDSEPPGGAGAGATRLAIPLVTSSLGLLAGGAVVGGVLAGASGLFSARGRAVTAAASFGGLVLVLAVTVWQSARAVRRSQPGGFAADDRVLKGLILAVVLISVAAWVIGALAAVGRWGAGLALAVLGGAIPSWAGSLGFAAAGPYSSSWAAPLGRWVGAAVLVVALVVIGWDSRRSLLLWPVAFVVAWAVGPVLTAAGYLEPLLRPGAGLPARLPDSVAAAVDVFVMAASPADRPVLTWVSAMVAAAAITGAIQVTTRRQFPDRDGALAT